MKFLIIFFLLFSILADFTSASYESSESLVSCDSKSLCADQDYHQTSEAGHDQDHCHCHAGHIHLALMEVTRSISSPEMTQLRRSLLTINNNKISNYLSEIIRPPIA